MKTKRIMMAMLFAISLTGMFGQNQTKKSAETLKERNFSVSTTYLVFLNYGDEATNTHHYEFHAGYKLTNKDKIGIKAATWKLFAPMGMPIKEQLEFDEDNFYPGRLKETGVGVTYQRILWKGLFGAIEILPLKKTYLDENNVEIDNGFKLYTSYHLGYHISLFKNRFYIEPQVHCNYWPVDSKGPEGFEEKESNKNNYILFEPNLYIGFNF